MDEKMYQAIISGEQDYLDISDLSQEGQRMMWNVYEFLLRKQVMQEKQEKK